MAGRRGHRLGKIAGLLDYIEDEKYRRPLEADLIKAGLRLRNCPSRDFTWRDLEIFIDYLDNDSFLVGVVHPERAGWTKPNMLLADLVDTARIHVWLNSKAGQEGRDFPNPIPRPGIKLPEPRKGSKVKPLPLSKIKEIHGAQPAAGIERKRRLQQIFR